MTSDRDTKIIEEIKAIAKIADVDFWDIEKEREAGIRRTRLEICKNTLVRTAVLAHYVLIDELLCDIIANHFFGTSRSYAQLWRRKDFQNLNYYLLEELSLLKKISLVKAIAPMPPKFQDAIRRLNTIRNAVAHSFFPENKRDFKATRTVTYKGQNIFTVEGLSFLNRDIDDVIGHLWPLAFKSKRRDPRRNAD